MAHRAKHLPAQLSGGQQQRVAVARAVAGDPLILLADEPTGNLDSRSGEAVMSLLRELHAGGATICMVTHDPRYVRDATRAIHLFDGRIVAPSPARVPDHLGISVASPTFYESDRTRLRADRPPNRFDQHAPDLAFQPTAGRRDPRLVRNPPLEARQADRPPP
jgi:energy-coupling factor transporter ATP-binding protein EcfA2